MTGFTIRNQVQSKGIHTEEDLHEFLIDKHRLYTFDFIVQYKKAKRLLETNGIQSNPSAFPGWMREEITRKNYDGYNSRFKCTITSHDYYRVKEFLDTVEPYFKEHSPEDVAVMDIKLNARKMNDGKNGVSFKTQCVYHRLKTKEQIDRLIRNNIKLVINELFSMWFNENHNNAAFPVSKILPSVLLEQVIKKEIGYNDFMKKLMDSRLKSDEKKHKKIKKN
jgi:hypothetical protein